MSGMSKRLNPPLPLCGGFKLKGKTFGFQCMMLAKIELDQVPFIFVILKKMVTMSTRHIYTNATEPTSLTAN
ncbi:hypothetical protein TWF706_009613 [Orbilia oligospora]|nr:hypothetical protein TWF706_009613 [Orbilia oligospora]